MFLQPMKKEDIPPMTLMSMWNQVRNAATQGVQGGFAKVGETIQKTPLLKLGVNVLNAADYGLGTIAKTTEGLLTDRVNTLKNLQYQPGEGLKSYANRNVTDISPYVTQKVAGTQFGQKFPMVAPILGLGAGMITPSPSDALKAGKFASQAGDVAKFSDDATELVKPSMLEINPEWTTVYRGQRTNKLNMNEKSAGIGKSFTTDKKIAEVYGNKGKIIDGVVDNQDILRYNELDSNTKKYIKSIIDERIDDVKIGLENENIKPFEELVIELGEIAKIKNKKAIDINSFGIPSESEIRILSEDAIKKIKPKLDPLASEAKKYKTVNDFRDALNINYEDSWKGVKDVNADKLKESFSGYIFHGTNAADSIKKTGFQKGYYPNNWNAGVYFSETPDVAIQYMNEARGSGKNFQIFLTKAKDYKLKDVPFNTFHGVNKGYSDFEYFVNNLKNKKYDGIKNPETKEVLIWNTDKIKNPTTLEDIWNKAHGK